MVQLTVSAPPRGLQFLTGCWKGVEDGDPSPWDREGERISSRFDFRTDQDGLCVIADYREQLEGRVAYRAHVVLGWDQEQGCPYLFWFDGRGRGACPSPALGRWEEHKLIFEADGPRESVRFSYQLEGPDHFTFRRELASGKPLRRSVAEARFVRVPEAEQPGEPRDEAAPARVQPCPFLPLCPAAVMAAPQKAQ